MNSKCLKDECIKYFYTYSVCQSGQDLSLLPGTSGAIIETAN